MCSLIKIYGTWWCMSEDAWIWMQLKQRILFPRVWHVVWNGKTLAQADEVYSPISPTNNIYQVVLISNTNYFKHIFFSRFSNFTSVWAAKKKHVKENEDEIEYGKARTRTFLWRENYSWVQSFSFSLGMPGGHCGFRNLFPTFWSVKVLFICPCFREYFDTRFKTQHKFQRRASECPGDFCWQKYDP